MTEIEDKYPATIIDIRRNMGLAWDETRKDAEILAMPRAEKFRRFMNWNGIIGYDEMIKAAISEIYEVELKEENDGT